MNPVLLAASIVCTLAVLGLLVADHRKDARLHWICKPLASLCFVVAGGVLGGLSGHYALTIFAGLVLCLGGDVLLIPRKEWTFLAGLGSFLLGHLAFAAAFMHVAMGYEGFWNGAGIGLGSAAAIAVPAMFFIFPHVPAPMRVPVIAYVAVIAFMVGTATGAWWVGATPLLPIGAVMFLVSDLSVAIDRFVKESTVNRLWGLPLYFASVMVIASTAGAPFPG